MAMTAFVKEPPVSYTRHDQLFKQLIHTFFEEFLEAFFPDIHHHIDFQAIKPFSEEVYSDLVQGDTRRLDIVVETKLKGTDTVVIVHIEPQNSKQDDFHKRMFHYFTLLINIRNPLFQLLYLVIKKSGKRMNTRWNPLFLTC
jgi:hypothetical protein